MIRITFPVPKHVAYHTVSGIETRANTILKQGYISEVPHVRVIDDDGPYSDGVSVIEIDCKECDQGIWFAFYMGIVHARSFLSMFNIKRIDHV
jgi:hypothetical protein